ncbi:biopolymer transporter ExbD [bacterium]|jgi:biopolymer transport protein ExbD|nr:biopolymer transporter ExbD [bacterium]
MVRRRRSPGPLDADFTAMLDLIFNLLAFFVVTFNPPSAELNFDFTLPESKQGASKQPPPDSFEFEGDLFKDVTIRLSAGADGSLAGIAVEGQKVDGLSGLSAKIQRMSGTLAGMVHDGEPALETAQIVADPTLKYVHVVEVVDACYKCRLSKINFREPAKSPSP